MSHSGTTVTVQGYLSPFADEHEEWPDTYVVVRVEPHLWRATLELPQLVDVVQGRRDGPVRGVRCERGAGEVTLRLGPAVVRGPVDQWLRLAARVRDRSGSAEELLEAPSASEWDGPTTVVDVEDVVVQGTLSPALGVDRLLAGVGGFTDEEWQDVFGIRWWPALGAGPHGEAAYLWGDPAQLGAVVAEDGLRIGLPGGRWESVSTFVATVREDTVPVSGRMPLEEVRAVVRGLLRRRRRSLSWCRYCGSRLLPERRFDRDVCYDCASTVFHVVY